MAAETQPNWYEILFEVQHPELNGQKVFDSLEQLIDYIMEQPSLAQDSRSPQYNQKQSFNRKSLTKNLTDSKAQPADHFQSGYRGSSLCVYAQNQIELAAYRRLLPKCNQDMLNTMIAKIMGSLGGIYHPSTHLGKITSRIEGMKERGEPITWPQTSSPSFAEEKSIIAPGSLAQKALEELGYTPEQIDIFKRGYPQILRFSEARKNLLAKDIHIHSTSAAEALYDLYGQASKEVQAYVAARTWLEARGITMSDIKTLEEPAIPHSVLAMILPGLDR